MDHVKLDQYSSHMYMYMHMYSMTGVNETRFLIQHESWSVNMGSMKVYVIQSKNVRIKCIMSKNYMNHKKELYD